MTIQKQLLLFPGDYLESNTSITFKHIFGVYSNSNSASGALIGSLETGTYGAQLLGGFSGSDGWVGSGSLGVYYRFSGNASLAANQPHAIVSGIFLLEVMR